MLGFPYPGGAYVEEWARRGSPAIKFPHPQVAGLDFSFSGLKTSLLYYLRDHPLEGPTADRRPPTADLSPQRTPRTPGDRSGLTSEGVASPPPGATRLADICCSFQEALIDALLAKVLTACEETAVPRIAVSGGVAVNRRLRERLEQAGRPRGIDVFFPDPGLCTDNAAMIAACGYQRFKRFGPSPLSLPALARQDL